MVTDGVTAPVVAVYAPCPFCNGDMEPRSDYGRIRYEHTASRPDCAGFALYFYPDDPAQVAAWNRRSYPIKAGEAVPVGWMLVPVEPTEAMCSADAGTAATDRLAWNRAMYRAMIAASPKAYGVRVKPLEWREEVSGMWWCADASRAWARSSLFVLTGRRSSSTS
jgi:hypothetical protein